MPQELTPHISPSSNPKHPAQGARRMLVVLCCTAMLALVGVIRTGQPATSNSSAAAAHSSGSAVHTTSGGSASASTLTGSAGASAANPGAGFNTVSGGS